MTKKQLITKRDAILAARQIRKLRKAVKPKPLPPGNYTAEVIGVSYKTGLPILGNFKRIKP